MIIGISGKKQHGKDTVFKIIQYLTTPEITQAGIRFDQIVNDNRFFNSYYPFEGFNFKWQRKLFADKLKDIVCMLLNCTREQLEDNTFKEKELGEEWWYYGAFQHGSHTDRLESIHTKEEDAKYILQYSHMNYVRLVKLTPRKLLQLLGTECGREIIHPNIWVNALMSEYQPIGGYQTTNTKLGMQGTDITIPMPHLDMDKRVFPNWIITDVRFENEAKAIKDKGGIIIRVNRPIDVNKIWTKKIDKLHLAGTNTTICGKPMLGNNYNKDYEWYDKEMGEPLRGKCSICFPNDNHKSEIALDNYTEFDHILTNDCNLDKLVHRVKSILQTFKII